MHKAPFYALTLMTALAASGTFASAQSYDNQIKLAGISGLVSHDGIPDGFDAVNASAEQLEAYGFPMRPDPSDAKAYERWVKAVSLTRVKGEYINTGRFHRPVQKIKETKDATSNISKLESGNWSGYAITGGSPAFVQVEGLWIVPTVANTKSGENGYMSEWVGIDGDCSCNDLIQDGTEQQFTGGKASYYAWVEFIPEDEVEISSFPVAPGDVIEAYSSMTEKSGVVYGSYYMANYNTGKAVSTSLKIPPNTKFSGLSAEWIVERTEVNGSFSNPLPFYAYTYMDNAFAWRNGSSTAISYLSKANQNIEMYQGNTALSKAYSQDSDSLWFEWLAY